MVVEHCGQYWLNLVEDRTHGEHRPPVLEGVENFCDYSYE